MGRGGDATERDKMAKRLQHGTVGVTDLVLQMRQDWAFEFLDNCNARLTSDRRPMRCAGKGVHELCPDDCNCPRRLEELSRHTRPWCDMEKCIFLDKFLQYPKNFRKIASFLKHKSTKDVIEFYYDTKCSVRYKHMIKEVEARRRSLDTPTYYLNKAARQVSSHTHRPLAISRIRAVACV